MQAQSGKRSLHKHEDTVRALASKARAGICTYNLRAGHSDRQSNLLGVLHASERPYHRKG